ncbi:MAG: tetratricopeptide repeat protein [Clostridia bacterium]|nr:tetratricopeptide repeat protein [Clostridia bacterium]MBQ8637388.1 tetratricopeptide repeat protein [Clostridia bacterium]
MKKTLIVLAALFICYMINFWLGIILTLGTVIFLLIKNNFAVYALFGSRAYRNNNTQKAIKWFEKAIATGKASGTIRNNYAMLLLKTGNPKGAEEEFNTVINSKSCTAEEKRSARQYRCMAYLKQGKKVIALSGAKELFAEAKNTITYALMGYLMQLTNTDNNELLALCEEAYDYNSDDRDIIDNLIVALIRNNQLDRAKKLAAELRKSHPTFVEAFYHSALIELKLGNKEAAKEHLSNIPDCRRSFLTTVSEEEIALLEKEAE